MFRKSANRKAGQAFYGAGLLAENRLRGDNQGERACCLIIRCSPPGRTLLQAGKPADYRRAIAENVYEALREGVTLGPSSLVADDLGEGRLVVCWYYKRAYPPHRHRGVGAQAAGGVMALP